MVQYWSLVHNTQYNTGPWYTTRNTILVPGTRHTVYTCVGTRDQYCSVCWYQGLCAVVYHGPVLYCVLCTRDQYYTVCCVPGTILYYVLCTRDQCCTRDIDQYFTMCCVPGTSIIPCVVTSIINTGHNTRYNTGPWYTTHGIILVPGTQHTIQCWSLIHNTQYNTGPLYTIHSTILHGLWYTTHGIINNGPWYPTNSTMLVPGTQQTVQYLS